jgi:hypothetical protein
MKSLALTFAAALLFSASCDRNDDEAIAPECDTYATVRDLRGLDGCRFVFELADGRRLEPIIRDCIILEYGKEPEADPLDFFEFVEGKRVKIAYEPQPDYGSYCMAGEIVKITCLTEEEITAQQ